MTMAEPTEAQNSTPVIATLVAMPGDVEQQKFAGAVAIISPTHVNEVHDEGKGLGIAMFVLLLVGNLFLFILPMVSFVCVLATIIIALVLTCGCCCAGEYNLKPNVKKFAKATLASLCLMFVVQIVGLTASAAAMSADASNGPGASVVLLLVLVLSVILNIMAIIFSALFTWGRGYGRQQPIGAMVV